MGFYEKRAGELKDHGARIVPASLADPCGGGE
jgi:hypothetical protein